MILKLALFALLIAALAYFAIVVPQFGGNRRSRAEGE